MLIDQSRFNELYYFDPSIRERTELTNDDTVRFMNNNGHPWTIGLNSVLEILLAFHDNYLPIRAVIESHPKFSADHPWRYNEKIFREVFRATNFPPTPTFAEARQHARSQTRSFILMLDKIACSILNEDHNEDRLHFDEESLKRISSLIQAHEYPTKTKSYTSLDCADTLKLPTETIDTWTRLLKRKGQCIFYGPPGTSKTFTAGNIARAIAGEDGIVEIIQFHPAYEYEDFVQGIRAETVTGNVSYFLKNGHLLNFCENANSSKGDCVLIIDEINRANIARVFGELMYCLEYRDQPIKLSQGGEFRMPPNLYLIGTMNTADRSIAIIDHALRRRFAFFELRPNYDIVKAYHKQRYDCSALIELLSELNTAIGDKSFHIGHSYFLCEDLGNEIQMIWESEVFPFIEEYFADRPRIAFEYSWQNVASRINRR